MSTSFRDKAFGGSKRHQPLHNTMPIHPIEDLPSPFGDLGPNLSESDLRETAYQILVGACRSSASKPLTFISNSEKGDRNQALSPSPSLHRSLTSTAASKVKKALGLKTSSSQRKGGGESVKSKRAVTTGELMRVQMRVSEQTDTRIRRALLRVAASQV